MARKPSWRMLTMAEPQLAGLLKEIRALQPTENVFCANRTWGVDGYKRRMEALVGIYRQGAGAAILRTHEAYDVAYDVLYNALPDCHNCWCF